MVDDCLLDGDDRVDGMDDGADASNGSMGVAEERCHLITTTSKLKLAKTAFQMATLQTLRHPFYLCHHPYHQLYLLYTKSPHIKLKRI